MSKAKIAWRKLHLRFKVALIIALLCSMSTWLLFVLKKDMFSLLTPLILFSLIFYCGFEGSGALPDTICDNEFLTITIVVLTIFLMTFIIGIFIGFIFEKIVKFIPYLKNEKIRRNFIFIIVSLFIISIILTLILQNS